MLNHRKTVIVGLCVAIILGILTSGAFAQTEWERYEGNPILDKGANGEWDGFSVFGTAVLFDKNDPDPASALFPVASPDHTFCWFLDPPKLQS